MSGLETASYYITSLKLQSLVFCDGNHRQALRTQFGRLCSHWPLQVLKNQWDANDRGTANEAC